MQKSDNHYDADMAMIRIQALEWVQAQIQDINDYLLHVHLSQLDC
jgi:hypothetical protein